MSCWASIPAAKEPFCYRLNMARACHQRQGRKLSSEWAEIESHESHAWVENRMTLSLSFNGSTQTASTAQYWCWTTGVLDLSSNFFYFNLVWYHIHSTKITNDTCPVLSTFYIHKHIIHSDDMGFRTHTVHGNSHSPKSSALSPLCPECMNPMPSGKRTNHKIMRSTNRLPMQPKRLQ